MNKQTYDSAIAVAEAAAHHAAETLSSAIAQHGKASWLLAGGTTPNLAYEIMSSSYLDYLDWSLVTFAIGDERIGPLDGPDNNWQAIEELFLQHVPEATFLRPKSDLTAEEAAHDYSNQLLQHFGQSGIPHFDLAWLGMGPDGHTLSLFPEHPDFDLNSSELVVPVHNSPKPPSDRISLSLKAISNSNHTVVIATGESKKEAVAQALQPGCKLPIAQAAATNTHSLWLLDEAATP